MKHEPVPLRETWEALEELVDAGLIRHLGVSNMSSVLLMDLLKYARIKPSVLQIGALYFCPPRSRDTDLTCARAKKSTRTMCSRARSRTRNRKGSR